MTGYNIYRWGDGELPVVISRRMAPDRQYNDTNVNNGIEYNYYMTALNDVGESDPTETITVTPLGVPTEPRLLSSTSGDRYVRLMWEPPLSTEGDPLIGYNIYKGPSEDALISYRSLGDLVYFNDTYLENGVKYYYSITAFNSVGESIRSNVVHNTPLGAPSAPSNLSLHGGVGYIDVAWEYPNNDGGSPISGFKVYRKDTVNLLNEVYSCIDSVHSFRDIDLTGGVTYYYSVIAENNIGSSNLTSTVSLTHQEVSSQPEYLEGIAGDGFVNITWQPPLNMKGSTLIGYKVLRGPSATRLIPLNETDEGTLYLNDTSVTNGETYIYSVQAICDVWGSTILSKGSDIGSFSPKESAVEIIKDRPSPPMNLVYKLEGKNIVLTWDRPNKDGNSSITGYRVYRSVGGERTVIGNTGPFITTYTDDLVKYDVNYSYHITAVNIIGESAPSNMVSCSIPSPESEPENDILPFIIGAIVIALVLLSAVMVFFILRRKKTGSDTPPLVVKEAVTVPDTPALESVQAESVPEASEFIQAPPEMEDPIVEKAEPNTTVDDLLSEAGSGIPVTNPRENA